MICKRYAAHVTTDKLYQAWTNVLGFTKVDLFPFQTQLLQLLKSVSNKARLLFTDEEDPEKYAKNLVKVVIYFEEFNFEKIIESPAYPVSVCQNLVRD